MASIAVFDVGNVLVHWDLHAAFRPDFTDDDAIAAWLDRIGFHEWNLKQDAGRGLAQAVTAAEATHGTRAAPLRHYRTRFADTIRRPITGSWALIDALQGRKTPLYAITNWSAELWPTALALHPRLGQVFEDIVISGVEGLIKPDPAIYHLLLRRNRLAAADCLFIDDSVANVQAARDAGMQAVQFTTPDRLRQDLIAHQLL